MPHLTSRAVSTSTSDSSCTANRCNSLAAALNQINTNTGHINVLFEPGLWEVPERAQVGALSVDFSSMSVKPAATSVLFNCSAASQVHQAASGWTNTRFHPLPCILQCSPGKAGLLALVDLKVVGIQFQLCTAANPDVSLLVAPVGPTTASIGPLGAAIFASMGASLVLRQSAFVNNTANDVGGAISLASASLSVESCYFAFNTARGGGALIATELQQSQNIMGLDVVVVRRSETTAAIRGSFFVQNAALSAGGGVLLAAASIPSTQHLFENCSFSFNFASTGGGLVCQSCGLVHLASAHFSSNRATMLPDRSGGIGGAIVIQGMNAGVIAANGSTVFSSNHAVAAAGALAVSDGAEFSTLAHTQVTFDHNTAQEGMGAAILLEQADFKAMGKIICSDNTASLLGGCAILSNSNFTVQGRFQAERNLQQQSQTGIADLPALVQGFAADPNSRGGGAIAAISSRLTLRFLTTRENTAQAGGALLCLQCKLVIILEAYLFQDSAVQLGSELALIDTQGRVNVSNFHMVGLYRPWHQRSDSGRNFLSQDPPSIVQGGPPHVKNDLQVQDSEKLWRSDVYPHNSNDWEHSSVDIEAGVSQLGGAVAIVGGGPQSNILFFGQPIESQVFMRISQGRGYSQSARSRHSLTTSSISGYKVRGESTMESGFGGCVAVVNAPNVTFDHVMINTCQSASGAILAVIESGVHVDGGMMTRGLGSLALPSRAAIFGGGLIVAVGANTRLTVSRMALYAGRSSLGATMACYGDATVTLDNVATSMHFWERYRGRMCQHRRFPARFVPCSLPSESSRNEIFPVPIGLPRAQDNDRQVFRQCIAGGFFLVGLPWSPALASLASELPPSSCNMRMLNSDLHSRFMDSGVGLVMVGNSSRLDLENVQFTDSSTSVGSLALVRGGEVHAHNIFANAMNAYDRQLYTGGFHGEMGSTMVLDGITWTAFDHESKGSSNAEQRRHGGIFDATFPGGGSLLTVGPRVFDLPGQYYFDEYQEILDAPVNIVRLSNAFVDGVSTSSAGGAMFLEGRADVRIENFTVETAVSQGPAAVMMIGGDPFDFSGNSDYPPLNVVIKNMIVENTTADASSGGAIAIYHPSANVSIDNVLLRGCTLYGTGGGGCIVVADGARLVLTNATMVAPWSHGFGGGGMLVESGATVLARGLTIIDAEAKNTGVGGAVAVTDAQSTFECTNCTFTNCSAVGSHGGAVLVNGQAKAVFIDSVLQDSKSGRNGGSIMVTDTSSSLILLGTAFVRSSSGGAGGALAIAGDAALQSHGSTFVNCSSLNAGGGIHVQSSAASVSESRFYGCSTRGSSSVGGGVSCSSCELNLQSTHFESSNSISGGDLFVTGGDSQLVGYNLSSRAARSTSAGGFLASRNNAAISLHNTTCQMAMSGDGGAISVSQASVVHLEGISTFEGCSASSSGGTLWVSGQGSRVRTSGATRFHSSSAPSGGAISIKSQASLVVSDSVLHIDSAVSSTGPAGVEVAQADVLLLNGTMHIAGATTSGSGGGIGVLGGSKFVLAGHSLLNLTHCSAGISGGGIEASGIGSVIEIGRAGDYLSPEVLVNGCTSGLRGGGVSLSQAASIISAAGKVSLSSNTVSDQSGKGAGLYADSAASATFFDLELANNRLTGTLASGAGISLSQASLLCTSSLHMVANDATLSESTTCGAGISAELSQVQARELLAVNNTCIHGQGGALSLTASTLSLVETHSTPAVALLSLNEARVGSALALDSGSAFSTQGVHLDIHSSRSDQNSVSCKGSSRMSFNGSVGMMLSDVLASSEAVQSFLAVDSCHVEVLSSWSLSSKHSSNQRGILMKQSKLGIKPGGSLSIAGFGSPSLPQGGGLLVSRGSHLEVARGGFLKATWNQAEIGAGIVVEDSSVFQVAVETQVSADSSSGLACNHSMPPTNGGVPPFGHVHLLVEKNSAQTSAGLQASSGSLVCLAGANIRENHASSSGSAVVLRGVDSSSMLRSTTIQNNTAGCSQAGLVCMNDALGGCGGSTLWLYGSVVDGNIAPQTVRQDVACTSSAANQQQCNILQMPDLYQVDPVVRSPCSLDAETVRSMNAASLCTSSDKSERAWFMSPFGSNSSCCGASGMPCSEISKTFLSTSLQDGDSLVFSQGQHDIAGQPVAVTGGNTLQVEGSSSNSSTIELLESRSGLPLFQVITGDASTPSNLSVTGLSVLVHSSQTAPVFECTGTAQVPGVLKLTNVRVFAAPSQPNPRCTFITASNCLVHLVNVSISGMHGSAIFAASFGTRIEARGLSISSGTSDTGGSGIFVTRQAQVHLKASRFESLGVQNGQRGGAVQCSEASRFECVGCTFKQNGLGSQEGGDIYATQCEVTLKNSSSVGSTAVRGGHAFLGLGSTYRGSGLHIMQSTAGLGEGGTGGAYHVQEASVLSLSHVNIVEAQSGDRGGALYTTNAAVNLHNVTIQASNATNDGGCVLLAAESSAIFDKCKMKACTASNQGQGGAVTVLGGSEARISNSTFSDCQGAEGGCVAAVSSSLYMGSTTFRAGRATGHGGCVLFQAGSELLVSQTLQLSDVFFTNCSTSQESGGGLSVAGLGAQSAAKLEVSLLNSKFDGCTAPTATGGGVSILGLVDAMIGCKAAPCASSFTNCSAASGGGLAVLDLASVSVLHTTFEHNTAAQAGGGMFIHATAASVAHSIFKTNTISFAAVLGLPRQSEFGGCSLHAVQLAAGSLSVSSSLFLELSVAVVLRRAVDLDTGCDDALSCTAQFMQALQSLDCPRQALALRRCSDQSYLPNAATLSAAKVINNTFVVDVHSLPPAVVWSGSEPIGISTNTFCSGECNQSTALPVVGNIKEADEYGTLCRDSIANSWDGLCDVDTLPPVWAVRGTPFTFDAAAHGGVASTSAPELRPGDPLPAFDVWPVDVYGHLAGAVFPPNLYDASLTVQASAMQRLPAGNETQLGASLGVLASLQALTTFRSMNGLPQSIISSPGAALSRNDPFRWPSYAAWQLANGSTRVAETPNSAWSLSIGTNMLPLPPVLFGSCSPGSAPTNSLPGQAGGTSKCQLCPPGTFSTDGLTCKSCSAGFYSSESGATTCSPCSPGTFQPSPGSECVPCADGTYTAQPGQISCIKCPNAGVSCISGTIQLLSGFYFVGVLDVQLLSGANNDGNFSSTAHDELPLTIPTARSAQTQIFVVDLNVSLVTSETQVYGCLSQFGCVATGRRVQCAEGHQGIACGSCMAGYVPSGSACTKCFPQAVSWLMLLGLVAFCVFIVSAAAIRQTFSDAAPFKIAIRMGLNHIQILTLTGMLRARGTTLFRQWFALIESLTGLGIASPFAALRCLFEASAYDEFLVAIAFPPFLCVVAVIAGCAGALVASRKTAHAPWQQVVPYLWQLRFGSTWVFIGFISYAVVTMAVLNAVRCTDASILGSRWLINDMHVPCFEGSHVAIVIVAIIVGLAFCVGFPALTALILNRRRDTLNDPQSDVALRFGFLISGLKLKHAYYESVVMARKMLLSCIVLVVNPVYQAVIALLLIFVSLNLQLYWSPYSRPVFNYLEISSLWAVVITLLLSLSYLEEEQGEAQLQADPQYVSSAETWSTVMLLTVNFSYVIWLVFMIVRLFLQGRRAAGTRRSRARSSTTKLLSQHNTKSPEATERVAHMPSVLNVKPNHGSN